jgi:acetone carboxylase gamma subunit
MAEENRNGAVEALLRRELSWPELLRIMREPKEATRFDQAVAAYQKMVPWSEPILLPLAEHLFIVAKDGRAVVKTACGEDLCPWPENWKMRCRIYVRDSRERLTARSTPPSTSPSTPAWSSCASSSALAAVRCSTWTACLPPTRWRWSSCPTSKGFTRNGWGGTCR